MLILGFFGVNLLTTTIEIGMVLRRYFIKISLEFKSRVVSGVVVDRWAIIFNTS